MPSTLYSVHHRLEETAVRLLTEARWTVHHTQRTHPHILSKSGKAYHNFYVDRYSNKTPEALVIYFNQRLTNSLPKTVQRKWDITRNHQSMAVKIIVTTAQAQQVMQLVPAIIDCLEDIDYTAIPKLLPFELVGNSEYFQRLVTKEAQALL